MLPTLGYFRGTDCPFFANGLCQRPYCHFRHVKKVSDGQLTSNILLDVFGEDPTATAPESSEKKKQQPPPSREVTTTTPEPQNKFTYVPTPLAECNQDIPEYDPTEPTSASKETFKYSHDGKESTPKTATDSNSTPFVKVPEYTPSPLSNKEAKTVHTYSISKTTNTTDMEYDPMSNYSTQPKSKKRKVAADMVFKVTEEAKFSDDDDDGVNLIEDRNSTCPINLPMKATKEREVISETTKSKSEKVATSAHSAPRSDSKSSKQIKTSKDSGKGISSKDKPRKDRPSQKAAEISVGGGVLKERKADKGKTKERKDVKSITGKSEDGGKDGKSQQSKIKSSPKKTKSISGKDSDKMSDKKTDRIIKTTLKKTDSSSQVSAISNKHDLKTNSGKAFSEFSKEELFGSSLSSDDDDDQIETIRRKVRKKRNRSVSCSRETVTPLSKKKKAPKPVVSSVQNADKEKVNNYKKDDGKPKKKDKKPAQDASTTKSGQNEKHKTKKPQMQKQHDDVVLVIDESASASDSAVEIAKKKTKRNASRKQEDCIVISSDSEPFPGLINDSDLEALSQHDTYEECLAIFTDMTECAGQTGNVKTNQKSVPLNCDGGQEEANIDDTVCNINKKQRVAHEAKFNISSRTKKIRVHPHFQPSPAQVCHNRYIAIQKQMEENKASSNKDSRVVKPSSQGPQSRTARKSAVSLKSPPSKEDSQTLTKSQPKNVKRTAHTPKAILSTKPRPIIPVEYGSKIPANIRQRYLNTFIDECLKFCHSEDEAFNKALNEEKLVYQRCSSRNIYLNLCINTVKKLRSLQPQSNKETKSTTSQRPTISHEAVLGGKKAAQTTFTVHRSGYHRNDNIVIKGAVFYKMLVPYILREEQLVGNGFPRPLPDHPGRAIILQTDKKKSQCAKDNQRICDRCGKTYAVSTRGQYITKEECIYHWGKLWKKRSGGAIESRYSCCNGDVQMKGCCVCKLHVSNIKGGDLQGFVKTMAKSPPDDGNPGLYALDCEMCYTTMGLELTRVTVTDENCEEVYDTLVKPDNMIIDYNTRFSGIQEEDLAPVTTILRDVQAVLLSKFSADTILMGHSLESDLLALKMIHSTVVDTSVVFPHRQGPPYKRALRTLMAEYLNKIIQNDVGGHDSKEDANSCIQLMKWKVKEDAKTKKYL